MSRHKILVADLIAAEGVQYLSGQDDFEVLHVPGLKPGELCERIADCDAVIVRSATQITAEVMAAAKRLQVIGRAGIGVDNIDVAAATNRGIVVLNTPDANATTTAELALTHMFALSRHLVQADRSTREGQWLRSKYLGSEISGKTVGVVGFGTIGRIVAARCIGLQMKVIGYDPFVTVEAMAAVGVHGCDLDTLLSISDYVTIHCPLTPKTRHLINAERLALLKPSARLINCARGGLVDEQALLHVLQDKRIAGAALDVFEHEPPVDSPLLQLACTTFTPHLGASTEEAQRAAGIAIAEQVAAYFKTGEAISAVNLPHVPKEQLRRLQPYQLLAEALGHLLGVLADGPLEMLEVQAAGKISELDTRPVTTEAVVGLLREQLAIAVNSVNAGAVAAERGIKVVESRTQDAGSYVSSLVVIGTSGGRRTSLVGTLLAERYPRLVRIDDFDVEAGLTGHILITRHRDQPGVIGAVGNCLGDSGINISRMQVGADGGGSGEAMAILSVSRSLENGEQARIHALSGIVAVYQLTMPAVA